MPNLPNLDFLDDLTKTVTSLLPDDVGTLKEDVDKSVRLAIQAALSKLDLVTREEFDVQCVVLERTRAQLAELEQRIDALEAGKE